MRRCRKKRNHIHVVPAAMDMLGDHNWYLPRWLSWLPDLRIDGSPARFRRRRPRQLRPAINCRRRSSVKRNERADRSVRPLVAEYARLEACAAEHRLGMPRTSAGIAHFGYEGRPAAARVQTKWLTRGVRPASLCQG